MLQQRNKKKELYIKALSLYFFLLPLNIVSLGNFGSALKYIAIIPILIAVSAIHPIKKLDKTICFQLLFVSFALLSVIWTVDIEMTKSRILTYILLTVFIAMSGFFDYKQGDIDKIKHSLLWSSRTTAMVMILFSKFSQGRWMLSSKIYEDPNYLCCYLVFGIAIILQRILDSKCKISNIIELILYGGLIIATGSRGGLLAVLGCVLVILLTCKRYSGAKKIRILFLLCFIISLFIGILNFLPLSLQQRFSIDSIISSGGTGRVQIWKTALSIYKESSLLEQLFGRGSGTITSYLIIHQDEVTTGFVLHAAAHNIFIETLLELGVVGLLLYSFSIICFTLTAYKFNDKFAFAIIISMIILSLSTSLHTFKPYFNIMLFVICQKKVTKRTNEAYFLNTIKYENSICL